MSESPNGFAAKEPTGEVAHHHSAHERQHDPEQDGVPVHPGVAAEDRGAEKATGNRGGGREW